MVFLVNGTASEDELLVEALVSLEKDRLVYSIPYGGKTVAVGVPDDRLTEALTRQTTRKRPMQSQHRARGFVDVRLLLTMILPVVLLVSLAVEITCLNCSADSASTAKHKSKSLWSFTAKSIGAMPLTTYRTYRRIPIFCKASLKPRSAKILRASSYTASFLDIDKITPRFLPILIAFLKLSGRGNFLRQNH
ncbi:hypothetical protein ACFL2W_00270 [Candidatus Omnitrophota bacterium]